MVAGEGAVGEKGFAGAQVLFGALWTKNRGCLVLLLGC